MDFTSFTFLIIIGFFFIGYWIVCKWFNRFHLGFIGVYSILIYGIWSPASLLILIYVILVCNLAVNFFQKSGERKTWILWLFVFLLLMPLLGFKYASFVQENIGVEYFNVKHWVLPLGISFYVFTALALLFDVYNKKECNRINLKEIITLISYWPHLAAGPILRSSFITSHKNRLRFKDHYIKGLLLVVGGYGKKVFIADNLGAYVSHNISQGITDMDGITALLTVLGFGGQIYADFSGYSEMAIGFSIFIGYQIPANFNYPYSASSIVEFWHRWHISLSTWFRDYLYIPLGGSKKSSIRWVLNIFIVFVISGLWHGASNGFLVWGAIHGALIVCHKFINRYYRVKSIYFSWVLTFLVVNVTWSFFFLDFESAIHLIGKIVNPMMWMQFEFNTMYYTVPICFFMLLLWLDHWFKYYTVNDKNEIVVFELRKQTVTFLYVWLLFTVALFFSGTSLPFIYFEF